MLRRDGGSADLLITCVKCRKNNSAQWKCVTCNQILCESCKKSHSRKSILKSHSFVNVSDLSDRHNKTLKQNIDLLCSCKSQSTISLYCSSCSELVCVDCITTKHNGHTFEKLEKVNEQQKSVIQSILSDIERTEIPLVGTLDERLTNWRVEHNAKTEQIKEKVIRRSVELKEQIDGWTRNLVMELDEFCETEERKAVDFQPITQTRRERLLKERDRLQTLAQSNNTKLLLQGVNGSIRNWELLEFPRLNDVRYLPGPDILSNFPSPLGSFAFNSIATENETSNQVSPSVLSIDKTVDSAFGFLENEEERPKRKSIEIPTSLSRVTSLNLTSTDFIWLGDLRLQRLELVNFRQNHSVKKLTQLSMNFLDFSLHKGTGSMWVSCLDDNSISMVTRDGNRKSVRCFNALIPTCVHLANEQDIFVGLTEKRNLWLDKNSVRKIVKIRTPDKVLLEIERDENGRTLFTFPLRCCTNSATGDILAIDSTGRTTGRLIICDVSGRLKHIYKGESTFSLSNPFDPTGIACVANGNMVVCDHSNQLFHILNSNGQFMRPIQAAELDVEMPYSVACDSNGNFCVGNWPENNKDAAKLYIIDQTIFTSSGITV